MRLGKQRKLAAHPQVRFCLPCCQAHLCSHHHVACRPNKSIMWHEGPRSLLKRLEGVATVQQHCSLPDGSQAQDAP